MDFLRVHVRRIDSDELVLGWWCESVLGGIGDEEDDVDACREWPGVVMPVLIAPSSVAEANAAIRASLTCRAAFICGYVCRLEM